MSHTLRFVEDNHCSNCGKIYSELTASMSRAGIALQYLRHGLTPRASKRDIS